MRKFLLAAVGIALSATACERATAPQARDSIEVAQRRLIEGNLGSIDARIAQLIEQVRSPFSSQKHFPSSRIFVERGGNRYQMTATVFERVYLPPAGSGGRPFVRRSVLAWEDTVTRGIVLLADDAESNVVVPTRDALTEDSEERVLNHRGFVLEAEPHETRAWFGRDGELSIGDGTPAGACPFTGKYAGAAVGVTRDAMPARITCQAAEYMVSARTSLSTGDPNQQSTFGDWLGTHPSLYLDPQLIRGVRIVTQCSDQPGPGPSDGPNAYCPSVVSYWRDNAQFAPQLGVDLSSFRIRNGVFSRLTAPGTGRLYTDVPVMPTGPFRYTVYTADGKALAQATVPAVESTPWLGGLMLFNGLRPGARGQIIAPAMRFEIPGAPMSSMAVMNFELLPLGQQP